METSLTWFVIINPISGHGKSLKKWPQIEHLLKQYDLPFHAEFTSYEQHDKALVLQAIKQGYRKFISVGGDGTLHGIINGIMNQDQVNSSEITVGVIPIGTGNDWARTYQIPTQLEAAISIIKHGKTTHQDIGKIEFLDQNKPPIYFNNLAGMGFDAYVANQVKPLKKFGRFAYLIAGIKAFLFFKNFEVTLKFKSEILSTKALMVLAGIGKYSGGGMQLTDTPKPNDGLLDISLFANVSTFDFIRHILKLYKGEIHKIKQVKYFKINELEIKSTNLKETLIQLDGEVVTSKHIHISLISKALFFKTKA